MTSCIQEGDNVLFRRDKTSRVFHIRKNRQVYFEKSKFNVEALIGQPYGATFEIDNGKLSKVEQNLPIGVQAAAEAAVSGADNRNLQDLDSNQKMSKDDILKLKGEGATGEKIIEQLIENSETFKTKTEFSQAKFIKKKKKKHMSVFTALRPTPRLVMDMFTREPGKICFLRSDSLSQLLSYSNVMHGSRVAVAESCQGLVVACVLQRMGGSGKLIQLVPNNGAVCRNVLDYFSFPKEQLDLVYNFPMDGLADLEKSSVLKKSDPVPDSSGLAERVSQQPSDPTSDMEVDRNCKRSADEEQSNGEDVNKSSDPEKSSVLEKSDPVPDSSCLAERVSQQPSDLTSDMEADGDCTRPPADAEQSNGEDMNKEGSAQTNEAASSVTEPATADETHPFHNREIQRQAKALRLKVAGDTLAGKHLDSLIIACKYNPVPVLIKMLKFMTSSKPVVVFCPFIDPLKDCYTYIKEQKLGLQVRLTETWFREYQVLPQRTHPEMNMSGTGGYLLTFMTLDPTQPTAS